MSKAISQLPATALGRTTDLFEKVDGVTGDSEKITGTQLAAMVHAGVKRYVALMTANGLASPDVIVLENTLGNTIAWTRDTNGIYLGTIAGGFDPLKTALFISSNLDPVGPTITYIYVETNQVKIVVSLTDGTTQDDVLDNASVRIEVHP